MTDHDSALLLGTDHVRFGGLDVRGTGRGRSAAAISVGARPDAPSMRSKGDRRQPNEDAALVRDQGERTLLAVADAHWGHHASHSLIEALADFTDAVPESPEELRAALAELSLDPAPMRSRTTLTICVVDRARSRGFGLQWGDSSVVTIDGEGTRRHTMPQGDFVAPTDFDVVTGRPFAFDLAHVRLVAAFTDGIDQCHYRSPSTSVGPRHIQAVAEATMFRPEAFVRELARLALAGVDGHPGGEDNLVVTATRV